LHDKHTPLADMFAHNLLIIDPHCPFWSGRYPSLQIRQLLKPKSTDKQLLKGFPVKTRQLTWLSFKYWTFEQSLSLKLRSLMIYLRGIQEPKYPP